MHRKEIVSWIVFFEKTKLRQSNYIMSIFWEIARSFSLNDTILVANDTI